VGILYCGCVKLFCIVWVGVRLGYEMCVSVCVCVCVYVGFVLRGCVCMCGICNVWICGLCSV